MTPGPPGAGRFAVGYANVVVALRWWVIAIWGLATVGSLVVLPDLGESKNGDGLKGLVSAETPAVLNELRSLEAFGFPLLARTVVVQRNAGGLSVYDQARTVTNALAVNERKYEVRPILGALPLSNAFAIFPASRERDTTALTYLFFDPKVSFGRQSRAAQAYADRFFKPRDDVVGVTGSVPARATQGRIIRDRLPLVELLTLIAIVLIVGLAFRSLAAPAASLAVTAVAYVMTLRLSGTLAQLFGVSTPSELEPVVIAMLLGVVTDYVVFFFSALRNELATGAAKHDAARNATARFGPIVAVAGLAVAAGTAALFAAESAFFRALGPALVFTVLVGVLVAGTLVPAVMAVMGRAVFWPTMDLSEQADDAGPGSGRTKLSVRYSPTSWFAHRRGLAGFVVAGCVGGLAVAALPLLRLELGVSFVGALPEGTDVRRASAAAQAGFAPGILSPTVVLVEADDITSHRRQLAELGTLLKRQPGVAGVLGPGNQPLRREIDILLASSGDAARYLVVLEDPPLGATAINNVEELSSRLPGLLDRSGLANATSRVAGNTVTAGLAGDTATAAFIVDLTERDLVRIAVAALLANLLMLLLFLRAVIAALYLLTASLLSVSASLGLTTLLFDHLTPGQGLTFYVPFAAAVLLLAFGSDYNIFGVGHVWDEARHRPLAAALVRAMPGTTRALTAAGLALAASFGLLAVVPLVPFRQLAFAMSVGILLDVFVVRLLLMPALLTVVGPASAWPSKRLKAAITSGVGSRRVSPLALGLPQPGDAPRPRGKG
ncbi:MAG: MMPL family transporter [Actinomycetota bacterium]|nr:MMPL family transporter [Actinomycetota bacterium]